MALNPIPQQTCQVGDVIQLRVQFVNSDGTIIDLSNATDLLIKIEYPDGTAQDFTADLYTDGTDGIIAYITSSGDISQPGYYTVQGKATVASQPFSTRNNRIDNLLYAYPNVA